MLTLAVALFDLYAAGYILVLAFGPLGKGPARSPEQSAKRERG